MNRCLLVCFGWLALSFTGSAIAQETVSPVGPQSRSTANRTTILVDEQALTPYVGVTTDGTAIEGLYSLHPDRGASNADLVRAANDFLAALTEEQRDKAMYPLDDPEWRRWSNTSSYVRHGLGFDELCNQVSLSGN